MNDTDHCIDTWRDFVACARYRASATPELPVYTFVGFGDEPSQVLTCAEIDRRASALAARLLTHVRSGDRALLLFEPGLDYIVALFGCLYAGVIAVPAYPVEPAQAERTLPRLIAMVADCAPAVILGTSTERDACAQLGAPMRSLARMPWLVVDVPHPDELTAAPWDPATRPDQAQPAYLQYTSGSTGSPKGVMISHSNLMHNSALIARRFGHDGGSRGTIWLPPYHDMGLIGGILQPLYAGFPVALMSHLDFLKHPLRWLRTVSTFRATTSGGPNFAYDMLATMRIADSDLDRLDLTSWRLAFIGAEPIRARTLRTFATRFARCGFDAAAFYPCYGLAEHTLFMTGGPLHGNALERAGADEAGIACGAPAEDSVLLVIDPKTRERRADCEIGELWASGPSVAQGYWGQPALTLETFQARVKGVAGTFMRTGDYGYLRNGELVVTGRLKDMLIIRGANYYPHDLEATIETIDPEVFRPGGCAVFAVDAAQETAPRVTVVRELRARHLPAFRAPADAVCSNHFERLRRAITQRHGIVVHDIIFTPPSTVPKTTSGKVQRHACRDLLLRGALPIIAQWHAGPA
ncbi:fatty acyl-AMP ligase [Burkholderia gladioli]|uniref:Inner membrane fatty-acid--CoA ligase n=1 Tax=Burkholderia gladioli (strain BSR3) TaxID=999541 RepID=F2LT46_BURGS|nr:fatty acyl-AMP ligase [Burkholderia gladioli]AEA65922.1 inner membrane fatty-acid--CoA ligase [Burkholderia gladioli BSR3]MBW5286838.1 fatty acyl-AMP ligase [Burkholderia gladioli]